MYSDEPCRERIYKVVKEVGVCYTVDGGVDGQGEEENACEVTESEYKSG